MHCGRGVLSSPSTERGKEEGVWCRGVVERRVLGVAFAHQEEVRVASDLETSRTSVPRAADGGAACSPRQPLTHALRATATTISLARVSHATIVGHAAVATVAAAAAASRGRGRVLPRRRRRARAPSVRRAAAVGVRRDLAPRAAEVH